MTTADVIELANSGRIASADFALDRQFRYVTVPTLINLILRPTLNDPWWLRRYLDVDVVQSDVSVRLPVDVDTIRVAYLTATEPLTYIGDNYDLVVQSKFGQVAASPTSMYWIEQDTAAGFEQYKRIYFPAPLSASGTLRGIYNLLIPYSSATDDINLDLYLPAPVQALLVEYFRLQILADRVGTHDDPRYATQSAKVDSLISQLSVLREAGQSRRAVYVS